MVRLFGREDRRREQLLSAYVDGEVTAEEAREVEELLASSGDARRELAEIQATVDLVRGLPELELPRSFALDAAPKKRWTLWWPSVRMTGLATSVATMLLVGLVAGDMLDVLEQARFGGDDSEYASDESAFAAAAAPAACSRVGGSGSHGCSRVARTGSRSHEERRRPGRVGSCPRCPGGGRPEDGKSRVQR